MEIVQAELEGDRRAFLAHRLVGLVLDLLDDFLDARRMDAAVGDQPLDRLLRDLAAVRIEAGEDDRAGRVVDDQIDAGGELERADVAPLAADDAALEIVARQIDDRDRRLDRVLGGAALDGFGDVLLGAVGGRLARLGVEPLEQVGGVVPRVALDLLDAAVPWPRRRSGRRRARARAAAAATSCSYFAAAAAGGLLALGRRVCVARLQLLVEAVDGRLALGERRLAAASVCSSVVPPAGGPGAPAARPRSAARAPSPWPRAALPSCGFRRRARRP